MAEDLLEKKNHVILLMDCYIKLLTDKQTDYLESYYYEDLSISEIAEIYDVSRNAVFDQIKRATKLLEDYEEKLNLLEKHQQRMALIEVIEKEENKSHADLLKYVKKIKEL